MTAFYPYFFTKVASNLFKIFSSTEIISSISVAIAFFIAVAFYCISLQNCLKLIHPDNRASTPTSVWYMFLLPMNFIEDFFIIIDVSNSISKEMEKNSKLKSITDDGMVVGIG